MATTVHTREDATAMDRGDPLEGFREAFVIADDGVVYLDGNSLGRPPHAVAPALAALVEEGWGERLIRAWSEGWMDVSLLVGDRIGALIGAARGQTVVADSTTVCFFKAASAALDARAGRTEIVTDPGNFPTDRYVLEGLARQRGLELVWLRADPCGGPEPEAVAAQVGAVGIERKRDRSGAVAQIPQHQSAGIVDLIIDR